MTNETATGDIPESVLGALETVRASGETNMFDRQMVIAIISRDDLSFEVFAWLENNKGRYMEALKAMGKRPERSDA